MANTIYRGFDIEAQLTESGSYFVARKVGVTLPGEYKTEDAAMNAVDAHLRAERAKAAAVSQ